MAATVPERRISAAHDVLFVVVVIGEMTTAIIVFVAAVAHIRLNAAAVGNLAAIGLVRVIDVVGKELMLFKMKRAEDWRLWREALR